MSPRTTLIALLALLAAALAAPAGAQEQAANPRIALVIGEAAYSDAALKTSANDAGLIAQTLQAAGFDVVGARDLDGQSLRSTLSDFLDKAAAAGPELQAFVYLSGRGVQYDGENFVVPVDARIRRAEDVPVEAVPIGSFVHALAGLPGRARVVALDLARAGPYASQSQPLAPGLALIDPEPGVLIAMNATPGTLAPDEEGPYGVYAKTLAGALRQGGLDVADALVQTRILVNQETEGAVVPWSASKLGAPYYVFERAAGSPAPPVASAMDGRRQPMTRYPVDEAYALALQRDTMAAYREFLKAYPDSDQARRVRAVLAVRREAEFWRRVRDADSPRAYWTYVRAYPHGSHVAEARRRLAMLNAPVEPPADFEPVAFAGLPPPQPDETFYVTTPIYVFSGLGPPPPPLGIYLLEDDAQWRALPPPLPPLDLGALPRFNVGVPLIAGAVPYWGPHVWRRDGVARPDRPMFRPPPPGPPSLPPGWKPGGPPPGPGVRPPPLPRPTGGLTPPLPAPGGTRPFPPHGALPGLPGGKPLPAPTALHIPAHIPALPPAGAARFPLAAPPAIRLPPPPATRGPTPFAFPAAPAGRPPTLPHAAPGQRLPGGASRPPAGGLQLAPPN